MQDVASCSVPLMKWKSRSITIVCAPLIQQVRRGLFAAKDDNRFAHNLYIHYISVGFGPLVENLVSVLLRHDPKVAYDGVRWWAGRVSRFFVMFSPDKNGK